jgi:hypothetical protein
MDLCTGFDVQFLVGGGVRETMAYLAACAEPWAREVLEYLTSCEQASDFRDLAAWREGRYAYHGGTAGG